MFKYKISEDLSIRLIELTDAAKVFELVDQSRDYLRKWLPWVDFTKGIGDTEHFIKHSVKNYTERKSIHAVIIFSKEIVGVVGLNDINWSNKTAQIGYWLGESYQDKGIITTVVQRLIDHTFKNLSLNKVEIRVAVENKKSRNIPERLGFLNEGRIRQAEWLNDHYVDHIVYGLLAHEWRDRSFYDDKNR